jgi:hypothetical protein
MREPRIPAHKNAWKRFAFRGGAVHQAFPALTSALALRTIGRVFAA